MTTIAVLDPAAGISGDMTLGALIDAGVDPSWLLELPTRLGFPDVKVNVSSVMRCSIQATKVDFVVPGHEGEPDRHHGDHHHGMHVNTIIQRIQQAALSDMVKHRASDVFNLIAEAEASVHGVVDPGSVHLHEVGAIDAILDIVGAVEGFARLGVERIYNRPVSPGRGWVSAAHGRLPVPAPATGILLEGIMLDQSGPAEGETVTPTGAALLRVLSEGTPPVRWRANRVGWGAGTRDPKHYPNALRLFVAESTDEAATVFTVSTDVDDLSPEYLSPLREAVMEAGALDCTMWPTYGKKGRLGVRIEALAPEDRVEPVEMALLEHSPTAGVRTARSERKTLSRNNLDIEVAPSVVVRVKILGGRGGPKAKPEYDDVVKAAKITEEPAWKLADRARMLALKEVTQGTGSNET